MFCIYISLYLIYYIHNTHVYKAYVCTYISTLNIHYRRIQSDRYSVNEKRHNDFCKCEDISILILAVGVNDKFYNNYDHIS